jgi:hypothetical protein
VVTSRGQTYPLHWEENKPELYRWRLGHTHAPRTPPSAPVHLFQEPPVWFTWQEPPPKNEDAEQFLSHKPLNFDCVLKKDINKKVIVPPHQISSHPLNSSVNVSREAGGVLSVASNQRRTGRASTLEYIPGGGKKEKGGGMTCWDWRDVGKTLSTTRRLGVENIQHALCSTKGARRVCAGSAPGLRRCAGCVRRVCAGQKNPERTTRSMGLAEPKLGVQVSKSLKKCPKNVSQIYRTPLHDLGTLIFGCSGSNRSTVPGAGHPMEVQPQALEKKVFYG